MEERRKFVRVKGLEEVTYKIRGGTFPQRTAIVKDLSLIGINLYTQEVLDKNAELQLMFDLPDNAGKVFVFGRVIWQLASHNERYATGIRFELEAGPARQALEKFIHDCASRVDESREFVRCQMVTEVRFSRENDPRQFPARSGDISRDGMRILTAEKVDKGVKLNLVFGFPGDIDLMEICGKVVWTRGSDDSGYELGIIFAQVAEEDKQKIWRFIERYCRKQKRV